VSRPRRGLSGRHRVIDVAFPSASHVNAVRRCSMSIDADTKLFVVGRVDTLVSSSAVPSPRVLIRYSRRY
jgi:hypothetical protein